MRASLCVLLASCGYGPPSIHALCGTDAPPPDAPPPFDMVTPWVRHTIYNGLAGADGANIATIGGEVAIVSPWEQSSKVTVSIRPTDPTGAWPTVQLPGAISAPEDAIFADVDQDGRLDVITVGDASKKIWVSFGPDPVDVLTASAWTTIQIDAATNVQNWLQAAFATIGGAPVVIAGGRIGAGAAVGYFTSSTPRVANSYTWHSIAAVGNVWSIVPLDVDNDGDVDLVITDSVQIGTDTSRMGSRWIEQQSSGAWISHTIYNYKGADQLARYLHAEPGRVIDGSSRDTGASFLNIRTTTDWSTWTPTNVPWPSDAGHYIAVRPGDIDGDGIEDLVVSTHHADSDYTTDPQDLSGVLWLKGSDWARGEISGVEGVKFDNVELYDVDGDGDLDVVTTEQGMAGYTPAGDRLGLIWYANPRLAPP